MKRNDKTSQELTEHTKYKDYSLIQEVYDLDIGDTVELYINETLIKKVTILHGESSHVNFAVQDKGRGNTEAEELQAKIDRLIEEKTTLEGGK